MKELSIVVALLVVYNIFITYQLYNLRKRVLKQAASLTTEVLKQCMPLIAKVFNKDLNKAVNGLEENIMNYLKEHTSIPVPSKEDNSNNN